MINLGGGEPGHAELIEQAIEAHPVQGIEIGPGKLAVPDPRQHRLIETSPSIGEGLPVDLQVLGPPEFLAFADDASAPVHHGSEHVEGQRLDLIERHRFPRDHCRPQTGFASHVLSTSPTTTRSLPRCVTLT
jgi:hypothetical protein